MIVMPLQDERPDEVLDVLPYLFAKRDYITAEDGGTTACKSSGTSPVEEYTPDD